MGKPWIRSSRSSSITSSSPRKHKRGCDRYGKRKQYSRHDDHFTSRHDKQKYSRSRNCRHRRKLSPDDFENFRRWRSDTQRHRHHTYSRRFSNSSDSESSWNSRRQASHSHHRRPKRKPACSRAGPREISLSSDDSDSRRHKRFPSVKQIKKEKKTTEVQVLNKEKSRSSSKEALDMNHYYSKSGRLLKEGTLKEALKTINICLTLCAKDDIFLSKIYSRRGVIYSLLEKPRCSFQGFLDWEHAYKIDKTNLEASKNMSKVFFMAANKMYRAKLYKKAMIPCNHALDLDSKNGEAGILKQLLKRKIKEKKRKAEATSTSAASTSKMRSNPENALAVICDPQDSVLNEVKRLNILIEKALENENFPRALILVKQALRLHDSSIQDDSIFRKLFVLKQNLMEMTPCSSALMNYNEDK